MRTLLTISSSFLAGAIMAQQAGNTDATAAKAGEAATQGAKPLSKNEYKIQLVRAAVKRAVLAAGGR